VTGGAPGNPASLGAPEWAVAFLREARVGHLATADGTGRPLVVPVCFVLDALRLYTAVDAKPKRTRELRRLRNIADNPAVSLVADRYDEDWSRLAWVIAEGRADVLDGGDERERGVALLTAKYAQYRAMDLPRTAGPVIRIIPTRLLAWRARDG
jgi:PPOX class probable F420-dependent enzyme